MTLRRFNSSYNDVLIALPSPQSCQIMADAWLIVDPAGRLPDHPVYSIDSERT
jgi:hypothetical protein